MNIILEKLKEEYLSKIKTTKDLIYKDKIIGPHDIKGSYLKQVGKSFYKSFIQFGEEFYFYNNTIKFLYKLSSFNAFLSNKNNTKEKAIESFFVSEVQNSLWIEGIRSSKKKIKKQFKKDIYYENKKNGFDSKIEKNYLEALQFIFTTNEINEQNIFILHGLLTKDIDMGENKLDGFPYRQSDVQIGEETKMGIAPNLIKPSMDIMIEFINSNLTEGAGQHFHVLNSLLIHLNFEHIHPYYDMNGRMGRLLSIWYIKKYGLIKEILFLSESINLFKEELYYSAFTKIEEKNFKFDATYFVGSLLTAMVAQKICYSTLEIISNEIKNKGIALNKIEREILIKLISLDEGVFFKKEDLILGVEEINPSQLSLAFSNLEELDLIKVVHSKPKEYSLKWKTSWKKHINTLFEEVKK